MSDISVRGLLSVISNRVELLACLETGVTDKREIEDCLGKSRTTVNRWLNDLEESGLVSLQANQYELTLFGEIVYAQYRRIETQFDDLLQSKPLLKFLSPECGVDIRLIQHAEVLISTDIAPQEPVLRLEDLIENATTHQIKGISPVVLPRYIDFFSDQILHQDLEAEFVLEKDVMEYLVVSYNDIITDVMNSSRGSFARVETGLEYGLVIIDNEAVWVGIHEPGGGLRGAIINHAEPAIEWGLEQFERVQRRAEPITADDIVLRGRQPMR